MKYFKMQEFGCRCGKCHLPSEVIDNLNALVECVLDPLRERYGKPIYVNSGYRCPKHNKEVSGATNSQHMYGQAADIYASTGSATTRPLSLSKGRVGSTGSPTAFGP